MSVDDSTAPVVNNVEYRDTGVILEVKPRINTNQTVSLDVAQEVSRVAPSTSTQIDPLTPTFTQRKITSRVNVASGQTVVLGGLIQESETRGREKIPVLGDIPVVGELFGSTDLSSGRTVGVIRHPRQQDVRLTVGVRAQPVIEKLVRSAHQRRLESIPAIQPGDRVGVARLDLFGIDQEPRICREQRKADVEVIQHHVLDAGKGAVLHPVADGQV